MLNTFYTDLVTIYRQEDVDNGYVRETQEVIIAENVKCRIHKNPPTYTEATKANAEVLHDDKLSCDISVDIKEGDRLQVVRGGALGYTKTTEIYIAGYPKIFYIPFGNRSPDLDHQEVPLGGLRKI